MVWLPIDTLPAIEDIPPSERDSWRHLLLSNLLETTFDETADHLAKLGFNYSNIAPSSDSTLQENHSSPPAIALPFFMAHLDEYSFEPCNCTTSWTCHLSRYKAGTACAAALDVLDRLSAVAIPDGEEEMLLNRASAPPVILMGFCAQHVGIWLGFKIEHTTTPYVGTVFFESHEQSLTKIHRGLTVFGKET